MKSKKIVHTLVNKLKSKFDKKLVILLISLVIFLPTINILISLNTSKNQTLGKILAVKEITGKDQTNESFVNQTLKIKILNGEFKNENFYIKNKFYSSQAFNIDYDKNDEVILNITKDKKGTLKNAVIKNYRRDKYIFYVLYLFILVLILIGGFKGLRSLLILAVNIGIFILTVKLLLLGFNTLLISIFMCILFVVFSVPIVGGINKKTISAICSTFCSIFFTMSIILIVFKITGTKEISYQEMDYFTGLPSTVQFSIIDIFFIQVLIGTLGAVIDNAVSIASSMTEIYENNKQIKTIDLIKSGFEVGRDMLGTMTTTVLMAYISGSIPLILILLLNRISILGIISIEIYLEITRAIAGSIGIVVSIPITIGVLTLFIKKPSFRSIKT
ncbi:MAG: YibE/F family protein [Clostridiales bacterium]